MFIFNGASIWYIEIIRNLVNERIVSAIYKISCKNENNREIN